MDRSELLSLYRRYRQAISAEPLPAALVDLDALERNVDTIVEPVRRAGKTLRVASKSIRCVDLLRRVMARGGDVMRGVMAFSPVEASFLVEQGFRDILIAYPTSQPSDAARIAEANRAGARVAVVADCEHHRLLLEEAAAQAGTRIPVIVDVDVSYRPFGPVHVGVRRSPLHTAERVVWLAEDVRDSPHLELAGLMGYEAHIAGLPDDSRVKPLLDGPKRALKQVASEPVRALRAELREALTARGIDVALFNGGGTGSVAWSAGDPSLTEVTAGSGFLDSHLFDGYRGLTLTPAAFFALQITRRPARRFVTCQGGGFIASGAAGSDRLPIPYLPAGLTLTDLEGAGEVQTPLAVPEGMALELGTPVFFRHAKAGELAEHFNEYVLVRGDRIESRARTYRGSGLDGAGR